ncbi:MAG TPA: FAD-linked oxidase C-terminal domain-containing protein, partial [Polyangiaceae bacterium]|nr:FAD-linked oxidase C-terminal domain-containing protein [Polyangiaceae bacterium]
KDPRSKASGVLRHMNPLQELVRRLGDVITTDPDVLPGYCRDAASWATAGAPLALARPRATEHVQTLARWATENRIPLVARGAGTGVVGGANAVNGCVVVSFERMNEILELNDSAMYAVVQPGVLNVELKKAAEAFDLWYAPDPASYEISTLGGNVATNAGGLCCVKYGVTGDYVLALEGVLASGERFRTGVPCRKDVAGYDLKRLLVGSEGSLALITEITLRLRRRPKRPGTLVALFSSLEAAGRAVSRVVRAVEPALLELMDRTTLRAVEGYAQLGIDHDAAAMLIGQSDTGNPAELELMREACESTDPRLVYITDDEHEGQLLLRARRLAFPALERLGNVVSDDISVPLPRLPEMLRRIEVRAREQEVLVGTVAHAGDGNIHPLIVRSPGSGAEREQALFERLMLDAVELGGTVSGEHGIGSIKADFLNLQLDETALSLHYAVKQAFDPLGILNPGKLILPSRR